MRRTAGVLACLALAGCGGHGADGSDVRELLPDLDQAPPQAVRLERAGGRLLLTFGSGVDNVGDGPLIVTGTRKGPGRATMSVGQQVRRADGSFSVDYPIAGAIRYVRSRTHAHWHLLDFDRYELRREDGALVLPDRKTGFCLGDRYRIDGELDAAPPEAVWVRECGRGRPSLLSVDEGISVGYGDDYPPTLEGQYLEVTRVPAGRYLLVHRANPGRILREKSYANNAASVLLELRRPSGGRPSIRLLASCPDSDRCQ